MILTITLNPAVDQTIFVQGLAIGEVNRGRESQLDPAGKGVNVSRMAHRLGWPTVACGFLGGEVGRLVERALDTEGVQHQFVRISGQTRLSVTVVDELSKTATSVRVPGPEIDGQHAAELDAVLQHWLQGARVLVLAGRLPPGVPPNAYARYIGLARDRGVLTILDQAESRGGRGIAGPAAADCGQRRAGREGAAQARHRDRRHFDGRQRGGLRSRGERLAGETAGRRAAQHGGIGGFVRRGSRRGSGARWRRGRWAEAGDGGWGSDGRDAGDGARLARAGAGAAAAGDGHDAALS
jgi:hypothetical protein